MTNVNATVIEIAPMGGVGQEGWHLGYLVTAAKAAQNDTVTITNATAIDHADLVIEATGAAEPNTISGAVITATSATTGAVRGLIVYKP